MDSRLEQGAVRKTNWQAIQQTSWDVLVVGGGITGAGVALEAARLGKKVLLVERQDFAWGTSSRSSKMVHGGLRYMAQGDIQTTLHSVQERELLLKEAPGLVDLMHYVMPHYKKQFPPAFLFNALLLCYDLFARKRYRRYFRASTYLAKVPFLQSANLVGVTQFADAVTDDSRLVMRVLHEASAHGALCLNYVEASSLRLHEGLVAGAVLTDGLTGEVVSLDAKVVINASGAWVDELRAKVQGAPKIRPARGSHIVIDAKRLPVNESFTILHPKDKRPIFVYPWLGCTVIGTTDIDNGRIENSEASMSQAELDYLLELVNCYFPNSKISAKDVISSFAGVRPLIASGALTPSKEKRNHSIWQESGLISVSGGKLTTFRLIALDVIKAARTQLAPLKKHPSGALFTPLGAMPSVFLSLPSDVQRRLQGYYGIKLEELAKEAQKCGLGFIGNTPFLWAELRFALSESVVHLDDVLLRRTRLGLILPEGAMGYSHEIKALCTDKLGWDEAHWNAEVMRYQSILRAHYQLP